MTRMEKNDMYDEICCALADYEDGVCEAEGWNTAEMFYDILRRVSIMWDELTGDDEE